MKTINKNQFPDCIENLTIWDCKYLLQVLISHKLEAGYITFKDNKLQGLYEFKPKGKKSYYYNKGNLLCRIHNLEIAEL